MIVDKIRFYTGLGMMGIFTVILVLMFSPVFGGKTGLVYLDELFNSISKGSAYYLPDVREESVDYLGTSISANIDMNAEEQAEQTALLYEQSGAEVIRSGVGLEISGDLGKIVETCIEDADAMYHNKEEEISQKYGYGARQVLYNWWLSFGEMKDYFEDHDKFDTAEVFTRVNERAVEPAYNYFGIEPESVGDRAAALVFSLIFYIAYTMLYGFGIMYMIEGLGLKIRQMFPFRFIARVKQP